MTPSPGRLSINTSTLDISFEVRGGGNATRQIIDILPPAADADRLLVCEVLTPGGNWSSYPPHKHDDSPECPVNNEEIYYFRIGAAERHAFAALAITLVLAIFQIFHTIDVEAADKAASLGMALTRTRSPNADLDFIATLGDVARKALPDA